MEQEQDPSVEYIKAFNNGYQLGKNEPELLKKIMASNNKNKYIDALKAGQKQFEIDKVREITKSHSKDNRRDV